MEPGPTFSIEPGNPSVSALTRDAHLRRDVSDRTPEHPDPPNQLATAMERQTGISVRHEDLQCKVLTSQSPPHSEVFFMSSRRAVTNVLAGYI